MTSIHDATFNGSYSTDTQLYLETDSEIQKRLSGVLLGKGVPIINNLTADIVRGNYATMDEVLRQQFGFSWQRLQYRTWTMADVDGHRGGYINFDKFDIEIFSGNNWYEGFPKKEFDYPSDDGLLGSVYTTEDYVVGDIGINVTYDGDYRPSSQQFILWHTGLDNRAEPLEIGNEEFVGLDANGKEIWKLFLVSNPDGLNVNLPKGTRGARTGLKSPYEPAVFDFGPRVTENIPAGNTTITIQDAILILGSAIRFEGDEEVYIIKTIKKVSEDDEFPEIYQFTIDRPLVNAIKVESVVTWAQTRIGFRRCYPLETLFLDSIPKDMVEGEVLRYTPVNDKHAPGNWGAFYRLTNGVLVYAPDAKEATKRWRYGMARSGDYFGPWIIEDIKKGLDACKYVSISNQIAVSGIIHGQIDHFNKDHPENDHSENIPEDDPTTDLFEGVIGELGAIATFTDIAITHGHHSFVFPDGNALSYHIDLYHMQLGEDGPTPQFYTAYIGGGSGGPGRKEWNSRTITPNNPGFQELGITYNDRRALCVIIKWDFASL